MIIGEEDLDLVLDHLMEPGSVTYFHQDYYLLNPGYHRL